MQNAPASQPSFHGLGIAPNLLKRLEELRLNRPTPIQLKSIPVGITGEDLVGIAQTGTGKTLAFTIPMLQRIAATKRLGLVILPTRELALQVDETIQKVARNFGVRTAVLIGGAAMPAQVKTLKTKPHVIVATPGRLLDHLTQKTLTLAHVGILVLDEADRMLDMGFEPQIRKILAEVPQERQTMLFSATMPESISSIAKKYMKKPLRIEVAPAGTAAERVDQEVFMVPKNQKLTLLQEVLSQHKGTVLVFSRTKYGAKKIARDVRKFGHTSAELHSNRSLSQRREALDGFKSGKYRVLVATDIAARGIDVTGIELVVNYDLPDQAEDYVHRIGRTARAGRTGKAISFASPEQKRDLLTIERLIRSRLTIKPLPALQNTPHADAQQTSSSHRAQHEGDAQTSRHAQRGSPYGRSRHRSRGFHAGSGQHKHRQRRRRP